jgi:F-type H+-transporting ATPase subunit b
MKRRWLPALIVMLAFAIGAWFSGPASAVEEHGTGAGHDAGASASVNIFDPRSIGLGFWTIVVFVLLLVVLRKYAWGPMLEGLHKREQSIHGAIEEAKRTREEAQRLRDQLQREMDAVQEKVRDILDEARRNAQVARDAMISEARSEIQGERQRLHREIDMARDQALQEIWNQTARVATLVASKAIRRQLDLDDHRRLVDEAIADLRGAGDGRRRQAAGVPS